MNNIRQFLAAMLASLAEAGHAVWLFGGWAEELWGVSTPRPHRDIDLLYYAEEFDRLETFIAGNPAMTEIAAKQFSHKRAVVWNTVMIEFFLVQQDGASLFTRFFDGRRVFYWPADTLSSTISLADQSINIASRQALADYREYHLEVESAYQEFRNER